MGNRRLEVGQLDLAVEIAVNWGEIAMNLSTAGAVLVALVVFAYSKRRDKTKDDADSGRMEEKINNLESTLSDHTQRDEKHFRDIFSKINDVSRDVSEILGYIRGRGESSSREGKHL